MLMLCGPVDVNVSAAGRRGLQLNWARGVRDGVARATCVYCRTALRGVMVRAMGNRW